MNERKRRVNLLTCGAFGLVALVLASCAAEPQPAPTSSEAAAVCTAPPEVLVGAFPAGSTLPLDVALGIGALDEVGEHCNTEVKMQYFDAPQPLLSAVLGGQVNFAATNIINQLNLAVQGQALTGLVVMSQGGGIMTAAPSLKGTGFNALKNLPEDAIYAMAGTSGITALTTRIAIESVGLDPMAARFVVVPGSANASSLASGTAQIGLGPTSLGAQAIANGQVRFVAHTGGAEMYEAAGFIPSWTLQATPDAVAQYPELATEMTAAMLKALAFIRENMDDPEAVYNVMPETFKTGTTLEAFKITWKYDVVNSLVSGWIERADVEHAAEEMQKYQMLDQAFDVKSLPDTFLAPDILKAAYGLIGADVPDSAIDVNLLKEAERLD